MIGKVRHRGLRQLYEADDRSGLDARHVEKLRRLLADLDHADRPEDLNKPGYRLHKLTGELSGYWSVTVRANWRVIFCFEDGCATDIDLIDYH